MMPINVMAQNINVAFTIDNNYPIFTLLAISSILKNNHSNSEYTFHIVENNITGKNKSKMKYYVSDKWKQKIIFYNLDTNTIDKGFDFYKFSGNRITNIGMARVALPEILPKEMHKVIYLDGDILVTRDLLELYNTDMEGMPVALATNHWHINYKMHKFKKYYNSGVILMDLDKCRKYNITK